MLLERALHPVGGTNARRRSLAVVLSSSCKSCSTSTTSSSNNEKRAGYIDEWFASIVKPKSFYERCAAGIGDDNDGLRRCYFYNIDLHGRLFLEETLPKNMTSSIKDARFLDFFFKRLRFATEQEKEFLERANTVNDGIPLARPDDYPFVSPCGKELNFVRPAASPIVFHSLVETANGQHDHDLVFAGSLAQPFEDNGGIAMSEKTGRLYHKLTIPHPLSFQRQQNEGSRQHYGLIRSSVAVALSDKIIVDDDQTEGSGLGFDAADHGLLPIPWLPKEAEPGQWAMPFVDDDD